MSALSATPGVTADAAACSRSISREAKEGALVLCRMGRNDNEALTLRETTDRLESEALPGTCSPVGLPAVEGRNVNRGQLEQAAAG